MASCSCEVETKVESSYRGPLAGICQYLDGLFFDFVRLNVAFATLSSARLRGRFFEDS